MKRDVILELMDGRKEEADLVRPLLPAENEIRVIMAKSGKSPSFHLSQSLRYPDAPESAFQDISRS